jgi:hypothetical protein
MGNKEKPVAGWYDDPGSDDLLCYWDGEKFTDQFKAKELASSPVKIRTVAILSLVFGAWAFVFAVTPAYPISFLFAIPGLILGIIALARKMMPFWASLSGLISSSVGWLISIIVAVVVAASALHSGVPLIKAPAPAAPNSQSAPEVAARATVVWSGDGDITTDKHALSGDYKVTFTANAVCDYFPSLEGAGSEDLASLATAGTVESYVYGLTGDYYMKMVTGASPNCPWTLTFTPN